MLQFIGYFDDIRFEEEFRRLLREGDAYLKVLLLLKQFTYDKVIVYKLLFYYFIHQKVPPVFVFGFQYIYIAFCNDKFQK